MPTTANLNEADFNTNTQTFQRLNIYSTEQGNSCYCNSPGTLVDLQAATSKHNLIDKSNIVF